MTVIRFYMKKSATTDRGSVPLQPFSIAAYEFITESSYPSCGAPLRPSAPGIQRMASCSYYYYIKFQEERAFVSTSERLRSTSFRHSTANLNLSWRPWYRMGTLKIPET
jgi:hypothetical protein